MGIVAVHAGNMAGRIDQVFSLIMRAAGGLNGMDAEFVEFALDVLGCDVPVMARVAILLVPSEIEQPRLGAGIVRGMAVFAAIGGNGCFRCVGPRTRSLAIPSGCGSFVDRFVPACRRMTRGAQS